MVTCLYPSALQVATMVMMMMAGTMMMLALTTMVVVMMNDMGKARSRPAELK